MRPTCKSIHQNLKAKRWGHPMQRKCNLIISRNGRTRSNFPWWLRSTPRYCGKRRGFFFPFLGVRNCVSGLSGRSLTDPGHSCQQKRGLARHNPKNKTTESTYSRYRVLDDSSSRVELDVLVWFGFLVQVQNIRDTSRTDISLAVT